MRCRLMIDGNAVYEVEEECLQRRKRRTGQAPPKPKAPARPGNGRPSGR